MKEQYVVRDAVPREKVRGLESRLIYHTCVVVLHERMDPIEANGKRPLSGRAVHCVPSALGDVFLHKCDSIVYYSFLGNS